MARDHQKRRRRAALGVSLAIAVTVLLPASASAAPGQISTVAGNGTAGLTGDGGPATSAGFGTPRDVAPLPDGSFLIADTNNNVIRMVSPTGIITTVAGTGVSGYNGDGIAATTAQLAGPRGVEALPGGGFLIADFANNRVRMVDAAGMIHTVAGDGTSTTGGNGGLATAAGVQLPRDISRTPDGGFLIGEHIADCVRKVSPAGIISTVAGVCGSFGNSGNGGPATAALFTTVNGVNSFPDGSFLVTDGPSDAVRKVGTDGIIRAAAGNGTSGFSGDGGPAVSAAIDGPRQAAVLPGGGFVFADHNNNRIRAVSPSGVITTVAGNGTPAFSGDGALATAASLSGPEAVGALYTGSEFNGGLLIADADNQRIRRVEGYSFRLGHVRHKKKKGIAILTLIYGGTGQFALSGKGVKHDSVKGTAKGSAELRVRVTGKKKKKLKRKHKVKVSVTVTFTPKDGYPLTQSLAVKLIKKP